MKGDVSSIVFINAKHSCGRFHQLVLDQDGQQIRNEDGVPQTLPHLLL